MIDSISTTRLPARERYTNPLREETNIRGNLAFCSWSRHGNLGKQLHWAWQKFQMNAASKRHRLPAKIPCVRPFNSWYTTVTAARTSCRNTSFQWNDSLFLEQMLAALRQYEVNLLSMIARYMKPDNTTPLRYVSAEMLAVAFYINQKMDTAALKK